MIMTRRALISNSYKEVGVGRYGKPTRREKYSSALQGEGLGQ